MEHALVIDAHPSPFAFAPNWNVRLNILLYGRASAHPGVKADPLTVKRSFRLSELVCLTVKTVDNSFHLLERLQGLKEPRSGVRGQLYRRHGSYML